MYILINIKRNGSGCSHTKGQFWQDRNINVAYRSFAKYKNKEHNDKCVCKVELKYYDD